MTDDLWPSGDEAVLGAPRPVAQNLSDEDLMRAYRDGDASAFDELYRRHRDGLFRFILRQVDSAALAEELFQDVWVRLIDSRRRYHVSARFSTFLYRIARHRVIDHYRRDRSVPLEAPERIEDSAPAAGQRLDGEQAAARLDAELRSLPLEQRTAVVLRLDQGLGLNEIAAICGCGRETVKSRLRYGLGRLRDALGAHHEN